MARAKKSPVLDPEEPQDPHVPAFIWGEGEKLTTVPASRIVYEVEESGQLLPFLAGDRRFVPVLGDYADGYFAVISWLPA